MPAHEPGGPIFLQGVPETHVLRHALYERKLENALVGFALAPWLGGVLPPWHISCSLGTALGFESL